MKETPAFALVRGANDVASAVGLALARAGFAVLLVETPAPAISRRGQSFADAAFDGAATLEGVTVRLIGDPSAWARCATAGLIAMTVLPLEDFAARFEASVWVDARMRKRATPRRPGWARASGHRPRPQLYRRGQCRSGNRNRVGRRAGQGDRSGPGECLRRRTEADRGVWPGALCLRANGGRVSHRAPHRTGRSRGGNGRADRRAADCSTQVRHPARSDP
jgi:hypothetical protein